VGSVADWASAIGTVAAFSFGLWQWRRDHAQGVRAKEREQAEQVAAWIKPSPGHGGWASTLHIRNDSGLPIFDIRTIWTHASDPKQKATTFRWPALGPGEVVPRAADGGYFDSAYMTFRDAQSRYWQRDATGSLTLLPGNPNPPDTEPWYPWQQ